MVQGKQYYPVHLGKRISMMRLDEREAGFIIHPQEGKPAKVELIMIARNGRRFMVFAYMEEYSIDFDYDKLTYHAVTSIPSYEYSQQYEGDAVNGYRIYLPRAENSDIPR